MMITKSSLSLFLMSIIACLVLSGCKRNDNGTPVSAATTPIAVAPVIDGFSAASREISAGTSTTLTAVFRNGTASIDEGVGIVTSGTPITISPTKTTTYLLTVVGGGATATRGLVVTIAKPVVTLTKRGTFIDTGSLNTSRTQHTATLLQNGKVLIVGGLEIDGRGGGDGLPRTTAELYDPKTEKFIETGRLIAERTEHSATLLPNGKVLIAGGRKSYSETTSSAEIYDPTTEKFKTTGNLITARSSHTATLLPNGKVLIAGGTTNNSKNGALSTAELYDPTTGKFITTGSLSNARYIHSATLLQSGKVLVAGGINMADSFLSSIELYDPVKGNFNVTGNLVATRAHSTATLLANGNILFVGGYETTRAEIYNPTTGLSIEAGSLSAIRYWHTATLLPDGMVLIAGGTDGVHGAANSVELYDPPTATFFAIDRLNLARRWHTATELQNGNVLLVGGDDYFYTLTEASLYEPAPKY